MILMRTALETCSFAALLACAAFAAGCSDAPTAPDNNAPFTQTDLLIGTGTAAAAGNLLTVQYTGWYYNASQTDRKGAQFDSSVGGTPFSFTLGAGQVIQGWEQGLAGMRVGGIRRLVVPPALGYGAFRYGPIPPNATLLFELELLGVE